MKRVLFALLMTVSINLNAQTASDVEVPTAVTSAFRKKFPEVKDVKWEAKKESFKAEFKIGTRGQDVWFDKAGVITKYKQDFPKSVLPEGIRKKIETDFKDYKIDDVDKVEEKGEVTYEVELKGATDKVTLTFTSHGVLKKEKRK